MSPSGGPVFDTSRFLGFDQFFEQMSESMFRSSSSSDNYPPYNVERIGHSGLRITLAVAGFSMENLKIYMESTRLVILGKNTTDKEDDERIFIHRGIAQRRFKKSFVLAEGIEVLGAHLKEGLLHVDLSMPEAETHIRYIPITVDKKPEALVYKGNSDPLEEDES